MENDNYLDSARYLSQENAHHSRLVSLRGLNEGLPHSVEYPQLVPLVGKSENY